MMDQVAAEMQRELLCYIGLVGWPRSVNLPCVYVRVRAHAVESEPSIPPLAGLTLIES